MKIKFIREATEEGSGNQIKIGDILDLGDVRNANAIRRGMAVEVKEEKAKSPKTNKKES